MTSNDDEENAPADEGLKRIGPFRILELLGEGGMAFVYLAEQTEPVRRRVAVKILKPGMDSKQVVTRFESERQALAVLDHPNIAKIFDGGVTDDGRPYFAMELVRGIPITQYCDEHRLDTSARLELFASVCSAVQHAHHKGLIHRDLKPSNILVAAGDNGPEVRIIDFGIAKATTGILTPDTLVTRLGQVIGTPQYMSPEQAGVTGLDVDTRTDVYSLGIVLYELLVGVVPFDLAAVADMAVRQVLLEREPQRPSTRITQLEDTREEIARSRGTDYRHLRQILRGDLDWIAMKAMEKDRGRRYATVNGLELDVRRFLADEPVSAAAPGIGYRFRKFLRRNRLAVVSAASVTVAMAAGSVVATVGMLKAQEAQRQAEVDAETARRTSDFMISLFMESDPSVSLGRELTAREILDSGAQRLATELADQQAIQAALLTAIGRIYTHLGNYEQARSLLEDAIEIRRSLPELPDRDLAHSLSSAGILYRVIGLYEESEEQFREALALTRNSKSVDEANTLGQLLLLLQATGNYHEAEVFAEEALSLQIELNGEQSIGAANAYNDYGSILHDIGQYDRAEENYEKAISIGRQILEPVHPNLASYINNLASLYSDRGRHELAEPLQRESLDMRRELYGNSHARVGRALNNLALTLSYQGKFEDAEAMYLEALEVRESALGPAHPDYAETLHNLGNHMRVTGRLEDAEGYLTRARRIYAAALGDDHPRVNLLRALVAFIMIETGRADEAMVLTQEALDRFEPDLAPDHPWYHVARVALADALAAKGRNAEAEDEFLRAIDSLRRIAGEQASVTTSGVRKLVDFYERTGQSEKADDFRSMLPD